MGLPVCNWEDWHDLTVKYPLNMLEATLSFVPPIKWPHASLDAISQISFYMANEWGFLEETIINKQGSADCE